MKTLVKVILSATIISALLLSGCGKDKSQPDITVTVDGSDITVNTNAGKEAVDASGSISSKEVSVADGEYAVTFDDFTYTDGSVKIVVNDSGSSASLECEENILNDFDIEVDDSAKTIKVKNNAPGRSYHGINMALTVNAPVNTISCGGAAEITYTAPESCEKVTLDLSGTASFMGTGSCKELVVSASGGAAIDASALTGDVVKVDASGAADVNVKAVQTIKIVAEGASHVKYSCDTDDVTESVSGVATVEKA